MWCGRNTSKHNLCWWKFVHLQNLLFTLCECSFKKRKVTLMDSSAFDCCVKPKLKKLSNTELQNKQDRPTVCRSLLFIQPTLWFCCQANSKAPKVGQVFPYAACNNHSHLLLCLWSHPLWSWCYSLEKFSCRSWCVVLSAVYEVFGWPKFPIRASGRISPMSPYWMILSVKNGRDSVSDPVHRRLPFV